MTAYTTRTLPLANGSLIHRRTILTAIAFALLIACGFASYAQAEENGNIVTDGSVTGEFHVVHGVLCSSKTEKFPPLWVDCIGSGPKDYDKQKDFQACVDHYGPSVKKVYRSVCIHTLPNETLHFLPPWE